MSSSQKISRTRQWTAKADIGAASSQEGFVSTICARARHSIDKRVYTCVHVAVSKTKWPTGPRQVLATQFDTAHQQRVVRAGQAHRPCTAGY